MADTHQESRELTDLRRQYGIPAPGDEPAFLPHPVMDRLIDTVLALGAELWVERDRRRTLEAVLEARGLLPPDAIEAHVFSDSEQRERGAERDRFVRRVYESLTQV